MSEPALLNSNDPTEPHDDGYEYLTGLPDEEGTVKYSFCCRRVHVVIMTKIISIITIPFYLAVTLFIWHFGNELAFLFTAIIIGSVIVFSIHGAFKGSKMCLIPYIFLQTLFVIYDIVLVGICIYGSINHKSFLARLVEAEILRFGFFDNFHSQIGLLVLSLILTLLLLPLVWTIHVVYLDFLFIAEVDEMLDYIREVNENCSKDDTSPTTAQAASKINNF
ncbi:unnamed protein product [Auanema sp. JU1783]|nr:unnamed protein product [Auanema sp. JU1783]